MIQLNGALTGFYLIRVKLNQYKLLSELREWFDSLTTPREELAGFPICPYAKQAIQSKQYDIITSSVSEMEDSLEIVDILKYPVTIIVVSDYLQYSVDYLKDRTVELNNNYRVLDYVILDNDPRTPFIVNGVTTTFAGCYLWIVQSMSDLNAKHNMLLKTNYYTVWTQKQLDEVVNWRK
jgi:hypothetical protein